MNTPVRKHLDSDNKVFYTGDLIPSFPNRKARRKAIQKQERNPLFMVRTFINTTRTDKGTTMLFKNHIQKVFNKKKNKFLTIVHTRYI